MCDIRGVVADITPGKGIVILYGDLSDPYGYHSLTLFDSELPDDAYRKLSPGDLATITPKKDCILPKFSDDVEAISVE